MTNPSPGQDPARSWHTLYLQATGAAPSVAACVAAAFRLADQVWRQVAADPALDTHIRVAVTGEQNWARTALAAYQHLADTRAYAHLDLAAPLRCWADPNRLRAWLTTRSDLPGFTHITVAQSWSIDEEFTWDTEGIGTRMATLIQQAQRAGVFGVPEYTIELRQVTTDDPATYTLIEHQVTLHTPSGAVLASHPIASDHLADDGLSGVDAALAVLANAADVVDELLDAERQLVAGGVEPGLEHPRLPRAVRPNRGFAALDLTAPAIGPAAIDAPTRPERRPRR